VGVSDERRRRRDDGDDDEEGTEEPEGPVHTHRTGTFGRKSSGS
jgi:hypothetical protein